MTEDQLQAECWQWAYNTYPAIRRILWAVPNGGERDPKVAAKLQATGVIAGPHDLHMIWDWQFYTFEAKVGNNKMTVDRRVVTHSGRTKLIFGQVEFANAMYSQGGMWFEFRTVEEFKEIFIGVMGGKYKRYEQALKSPDSNI